MMVNQTFDIFSGDTVDIYFTLVDANGLALDLSNLALWWGMGDIIKTDITVDANVAVVHLAPEDTADLATGGLRHQLRAVDPTGRVETFAVGVCRVTASVFQPTVAVTPVVRTLRLVGDYRA